jgi:hypothetical protein
VRLAAFGKPVEVQPTVSIFAKRLKDFSFTSEIISVSLTTTGRFVRQSARFPEISGIVRVQKKKQFKVLHIVNKGKYGFSGFQLIYNTILYMVALWSENNVEKY